ncbi:MAG TPA: hypothetical protein VMR70_17655 [Flavisolibacter sp.]|nr:hypothetical protein [Flavisolibacter sp.]
MREKPIIQKLLAYILLVCLTIGFIPQRYFHDVIADHRDTVTCEHPDPSLPCVHQKGFNCGFNDLVVSAPFVSQVAGFVLAKPDHFSYYNSRYQLVHLQYCCTGKESRGPPSSLVG